MGRLRLIIGPPGSGKTCELLSEIAAEAARAPLGPPTAPPLVLLVPEQQAAQMERAVLETLAAAGVGANSRVQVVSFRWLTRKLELAAGETRGEPSDNARRLLVWKLLGESDPQRFADERVRSETANLLAGLIAESAQCATTAEALKTQAVSLATSNRELADKVQLLAEVLNRYCVHCTTHGLNFTSPPARIPGLLNERNWPLLAGTRVWVDGFSGFTPAEELALTALLAQCASVTASLLLDPQRKDGPLATDVYDWYAPTREQYTRWGELAAQAGVSFDYGRDVFALEQPRRWQPDSQMFQLASGGLQSHAATEVIADGSVTALVSSDERAEVEAAAREIRRLVLPPQLGGAGMKYGQISVAVRSLGPYADLLRLVLKEQGVPFFIDQRTALAHHPACELLRCGLRLALGCAERDDVYALLKCGLLGLELELEKRELMRRADLLENYARAVAVKPAEWIQAEPWSRWYDPEREHTDELVQLDGWRRELLAPVIALHAALDSAEPSTVRSVLEQAWLSLFSAHVKRELQNWTEQAHDAEQSELHGKVLEPLAELLDELVAIAGDNTIAANQLCRWVDDGISGLSLGFAPPRLDSVLVTEIARGRHHEVAATLLLGMADDCWPPPVKQSAYLSEDERAELNRGSTLLPTRALESSRVEPYLALVACTRPTQYLWLSRPAADSDGRGRAPSPFYAGVVAALGLQEQSTPASGIAAATTAHDIVVAAALAPHDAALQSTAIALAAEAPDALRGLLWARTRSAPAQLTPDLVAQLLRLSYGPPELDVRQLEAQGACPFRHYTQWLLGLQRREQALASPSLSRFYRKLFARALTLLRDSNYDWTARRIGPIREAANQALAELAANLLGTGDGATHLLQRAGWLLDRLTTELAEMTAGRVPLLINTGYGSGQRLDPIVVSTPLGQVRVRGRVDRIDTADGAVTVVDVKLRPGKDALNWQRFAGGAELGLPAALLATRGHRLWDPQNGVQLELAPTAAEVSRIEPHWDGEEAQFAPAALRPSFARDSANAKLDELTTNTLAEAERLLAGLAEEVLDGVIAIRPLRCGTWTACSACSLRPVCRFDPAIGEEYREVLETNGALRDRIAAGDTQPAEAAP